MYRSTDLQYNEEEFAQYLLRKCKLFSSLFTDYLFIFSYVADRKNKLAGHRLDNPDLPILLFDISTTDLTTKKKKTLVGEMIVGAATGPPLGTILEIVLIKSTSHIFYFHYLTVLLNSEIDSKQLLGSQIT